MKILVIAAHPDDEVLGVGGTLLKHRHAGDEIYVCMVTQAYEPEWTTEYISRKRQEAVAVDRILGTTRRFYLDLPTVKLNTLASIEINSRVAEVIREVDPGVIYTHSRTDINVDHGVIFDAVMVATRPIDQKRRLVTYETPSSTEWGELAFWPNFYVDIEGYVDQKVEAFLQYESEVKASPHPRSDEGIRVLARKRGSEICVRYAEAFRVIRDYWI